MRRAGANATVVKEGDAVTIRGVGTDAVVTSADLVVGKSVVHIVDTVLLPFFPTLAAVSVRASYEVCRLLMRRRSPMHFGLS